MNLKFTGTDGFKGLKHGEVYHVFIYIACGKICVSWFGSLGEYIPYESPQDLAADWTKEE